MQLLEWDLNKVTLVHFVDNYQIQGLLLTSDYITSNQDKSDVTKSEYQIRNTDPDDS